MQGISALVVPDDPLVIYHGGCHDGFTAAWLLHTAFPDATFIPATHGDEPPDVSGKCVIIADFSYPRSVMERLAEAADQIIVLDHHESAEKELKELPYCVFDMTKSGGRLTYDWLIGWSAIPINNLDEWAWIKIPGSNETIPWIVAYTEDRDLWKKELPGTDEINAALRSHPFDFEVWDSLARTQPETHWVEGKAIMRANRIVIENHKRHASLLKIADWAVPVVNATAFFSEIAGELAVGQPFAARYFDTPEHRVFSLRSEVGKGVNVAEVATRFGGGGHAGAAGFRIPLPVAEISEIKVPNKGNTRKSFAAGLL